MKSRCAGECPSFPFFNFRLQKIKEIVTALLFAIFKLNMSERSGFLLLFNDFLIILIWRFIRVVTYLWIFCWRNAIDTKRKKEDWRSRCLGTIQKRTERRRHWFLSLILRFRNSRSTKIKLDNSRLSSIWDFRKIIQILLKITYIFSLLLCFRFSFLNRNVLIFFRST